MPQIEVPFEVEPNYDGWRLDRYLQQKISRLSRQRIQGIIKGSLRCPERPLKPASIVRAGLRFVLLKEVDDEPEAGADVPIRIVHDDPHLLVLDKPAGLAVHPSARYFKHTVTQWLSDHALNADGTRPDLAHRLDRETSGLLACGRTKEATRAMKFLFVRKEVEKSYLALVHGRVERDAFVIDVPMRLTETIKVIMEAHPDGLPSQTEVRVLKRGVFRGDGGAATLVECRPKTGRQHQIRVHLAHVGHALVGDKIYGAGVERFLRFCRGEQTDEDRALLRLPRHALHAFRLELPHPITRERLVLEAPLAPDLQAYCDAEITWEDERETPFVQQDEVGACDFLDVVEEAATRGAEVTVRLAGGGAFTDRVIDVVTANGENHAVFAGRGVVNVTRIAAMTRG
jgi:23S rRNA pseudouridine1911/1915/1917 synthase